MKNFMKSSILFGTFLTVLGFNAQAALYEGHTKNNKACAVNMNLEQGLVTWSYDGDAYGIITSAAEIKTALKAGQNPVEIQGAEGATKVKLSLAFNQDGSLNYATYKERNVFIPKTVVCLDLKKTNN